MQNLPTTEKHPCKTQDDDFDHDWKIRDDSFDHEYGVEMIYYWECQTCGDTKELEAGDYCDHFEDCYE